MFYLLQLRSEATAPIWYKIYENSTVFHLFEKGSNASEFPTSHSDAAWPMLPGIQWPYIECTFFWNSWKDENQGRAACTFLFGRFRTKLYQYFFRFVRSCDVRSAYSLHPSNITCNVSQTCAAASHEHFVQIVYFHFNFVSFYWEN